MNTLHILIDIIACVTCYYTGFQNGKRKRGLERIRINSSYGRGGGSSKPTPKCKDCGAFHQVYPDGCPLVPKTRDERTRPTRRTR